MALLLLVCFLPKSPAQLYESKGSDGYRRQSAWGWTLLGWIVALWLALV